MTQEYYFKASDGDTFIPVADATHVLSGIRSDHSEAQVHVQFYASDKETAVTPSGGTIVFRAGLFSGQFLAASANGTVTATDVEAGDASYTPPTFQGPLNNAQAVFSGITGAEYVRIIVWGS